MRAKSGKEKEKERIVLFLRVQTGERYVFCGEVTYVSHDAAVHPIKFCWELADYDAMLEACAPEEKAKGKGKGKGKAAAQDEGGEEEDDDNFRILLEAAGAL